MDRTARRPSNAPEQPRGGSGGVYNAASKKWTPSGKSSTDPAPSNTAKSKGSAAPDHRVPKAHQQAAKAVYVEPTS